MIRMPGALAEAGPVARACCCRSTTNWSSRRPEAEADARHRRDQAGDGEGREPAVALTVPLVVDARAAANWDEAH